MQALRQAGSLHLNRSWGYADSRVPLFFYFKISRARYRNVTP